MTLNTFLSRLVRNTLEDLEGSGCIKMKENAVEPLMLGFIASKYYLSFMTVSLLASNIGSHTSLELFLHVLAGASEYDELPVRHNEENYNEFLLEKVPYRVDVQKLGDPHVMVNLLFQAHFSRIDLPICDYVTDLKSVLDQSIRIIQAMIDVCANSGWLSSVITCMHLLQMVMQGLWIDGDSPLWMLPSMSSDLLTLLSRRGFVNVQQLVNLSEAQVQALVGNVTISSFYEELQRFPLVEAKLKVQIRENGGESSSWLGVKFERTNYRGTSSAFTPFFPKMKDEAWWLVLGNVSTSELFLLKRVILAERLVVNMDLPSSNFTVKGLKLLLVSDCYLGYEYEYSLDQFFETSS